MEHYSGARLRLVLVTDAESKDVLGRLVAAILTRCHTAGASTTHLKKVHSEWCSKPRSEFGQKLAPASHRAANYILISLLDDRRRHEDHILGTMHT